MCATIYVGIPEKDFDRSVLEVPSGAQRPSLLRPYLSLVCRWNALRTTLTHMWAIWLPFQESDWHLELKVSHASSHDHPKRLCGCRGFHFPRRSSAVHVLLGRSFGGCAVRKTKMEREEGALHRLLCFSKRLCTGFMFAFRSVVFKVDVRTSVGSQEGTVIVKHGATHDQRAKLSQGLLFMGPTHIITIIRIGRRRVIMTMMLTMIMIIVTLAFMITIRVTETIKAAATITTTTKRTKDNDNDNDNDDDKQICTYTHTYRFVAPTSYPCYFQVCLRYTIVYSFARNMGP